MKFEKAMVRGFSMVPALGDRDKVLIRPGASYKVGDVIVFRHQDRFDIKRVQSISDEGVFVVGDNEVASLDSRKFGHINPTDVVGKAVFRVEPQWGFIPKKGEIPKKRRRRREKRRFRFWKRRR